MRNRRFASKLKLLVHFYSDFFSEKYLWLLQKYLGVMPKAISETLASGVQGVE